MEVDANLLKDFLRMSVHESGHALMAHLQQVACGGIWFEENSERFASMTDLPVSTELSREHYLVLAAGSAAEKLFFDGYCPTGAASDAEYFKGVKAPNFDQTVNEAGIVFRRHKSNIRQVQLVLKDKFKAAKHQPRNLPKTAYKGKAYRVLLSGDELAAMLTTLALIP